MREVAKQLGDRCPAGECKAIAEWEQQVDLRLAKAAFAAEEGDPAALDAPIYHTIEEALDHASQWLGLAHSDRRFMGVGSITPQ